MSEFLAQVPPSANRARAGQPQARGSQYLRLIEVGARAIVIKARRISTNVSLGGGRVEGRGGSGGAT